MRCYAQKNCNINMENIYIFGIVWNLNDEIKLPYTQYCVLLGSAYNFIWFFFFQTIRNETSTAIYFNFLTDWVMTVLFRVASAAYFNQSYNFLQFILNSSIFQCNNLHLLTKITNSFYFSNFWILSVWF